VPRLAFEALRVIASLQEQFPVAATGVIFNSFCHAYTLVSKHSGTG
jgi:hypothetical protein